MILIYVFLIGLLVVACVATASAVFGVMSRPKTVELIAEKDLRVLQQRDRVAERTLVKIAGGVAGNAEYEAQSALDGRDSLLTKELN